jgi:ribosomal-protein-alanine N-acetyltransferase
MASVIVRAARKEDMDAIISLNGSDEGNTWSNSQIAEEWATRQSVMLIAESAGEPAGYLCYWLVADEAQLMNIVVGKNYRHRGIARTLMRSCLAELGQAGASRLILEVRDSNSPALHLYESLGFRQCGRRDNYYHNGDSALVMDLEIEQNDR